MRPDALKRAVSLDWGSHAMDDAFSDDLRAHLTTVVRKEEGVDPFLHWFNRAWWAAESSDDEEISSFVARLDSLIYVLVSGYWTEDEFLAELAKEAEARYGPLGSPVWLAEPTVALGNSAPTERRQ